MIGYLNQPERTAQVFLDDWYITGDMAKVDEDGFLAITDRISRFSKVGGEMVPHLLVEEMISKACGDSPCVVTGLPDERKGERLAVLYTDPNITPEELWRRLSETDLPKLWLPKLENIHRVEELPVLGTGKLDLRGVRARALELAGADVEQRLQLKPAPQSLLAAQRHRRIDAHRSAGRQIAGKERRGEQGAAVARIVRGSKR